MLVGGLSDGEEDRDVSGLTAAVSELLQDAEARTRLGEKARVRAGEFSWEQCADGVYSVLAATTRGTWSSGLVGAQHSDSAQQSYR